MNKTTLLICSALLTTSLSGCNITRQDMGLVGGAVIGGVLSPVIFGNSAWYTLVGGAAAGGLIGSYVGKNMDSKDRSRVSYTLNNAPDKQPYQFMSSNDNFTVTPLKSYRVNNNLCRDFNTEKQTHDGKTVYEKGSACQVSQGQWQVKA